MSHPRTVALVAALLAVIAAADGARSEQAAVPTITLEQALYFTAPDGSDALAPPGSYGVEAGDGLQLRLVWTGGTPTLVIQATATSHQEPLAAPMALSVPDEGDAHHIVLLLPGGTGLDASGSASGVRPRGASMIPLSSVKLAGAISRVQAAPLAKPSPPAVMSRERAMLLAPEAKIGSLVTPPSVSLPVNLIYFTVRGQMQGKLKGEVPRPGFQDRMQGLKFGYDLTSPRDLATGMATGKRQHLPIRLTKIPGAASPQLFNALVRNELLPEVIIDFLAAGVEGQLTPVQTIKLTNAFLSGFRQYTDSTEGGPRSLLEDVVFTFQAIETTNHAGKTTASDSLK